jgi:hypothetical protein
MVSLESPTFRYMKVKQREKKLFKILYYYYLLIDLSITDSFATFLIILL